MYGALAHKQRIHTTSLHCYTCTQQTGADPENLTVWSMFSCPTKNLLVEHILFFCLVFLYKGGDTVCSTLQATYTHRH